jgi:hypothetical protein
VAHNATNALGTGTFSFPPVTVGTGWNFANAVLLGDADGDGLPDLISRQEATGDLLVYPHQPAGPAPG